MNRRHHMQIGSDGDSLQADVMRFMAIIAFCLIAVLALVRNVEPPPQPVPDPLPDPAPFTATLPEPVQTTATLVEQVPQPTPVADFTEPLPKPEPMATLPPEATPVPAPAAPQVPIVEVAAAAATKAETMQSTPAEEGLSLRFASDRDFLRLVTKGEIQVYAFQSSSVLGLDRNFEFLNADAPGQIYELLPETIPNLIVAALGRATAESASYSWGIRMPKELEGKIRGFIDRDVHGELVIDRYGEVHHVAS